MVSSILFYGSIVYSIFVVIIFIDLLWFLIGWHQLQTTQIINIFNLNSQHKTYETKHIKYRNHKFYHENPSVGKTSKDRLYYGFRGKYYSNNKLRNFLQNFFLLPGCMTQHKSTCTTLSQIILYNPVGIVYTTKLVQSVQPASMVCTTS